MKKMKNIWAGRDVTVEEWNDKGLEIAKDLEEHPPGPGNWPTRLQVVRTARHSYKKFRERDSK